jgi:hypothetical protein
VNAKVTLQGSLDYETEIWVKFFCETWHRISLLWSRIEICGASELFFFSH